MKTALIVDDEEQLLRLMSRVLEKAGIRSLTARDAAEAREQFAAHEASLDVLLLDVTLPGGEGAERLMPEFVARRPTARVIVTSGNELPAALATELRRIGGHYLRKPFSPRELLRLAEGSGDGEAARPAPPPPSGPA